jgi:phospholipase D1/2
VSRYEPLIDSTFARNLSEAVNFLQVPYSLVEYTCCASTLRNNAWLAAVVVDTESAAMTDVGQGIKIITRKFARDLRVALWKKNLDMSADELTTGVQKKNIPESIDVMQPLSPETINGIKTRAKANHIAYEKVFLHTPRDGFKTLTQGRQNAYPALSAKEGTRDFSKAPRLQNDYMQKDMHSVANAINFLNLNVQGFWLEMPLDWGYAQNQTPEAPHNLPTAIAQNRNEKREAYNV